jgi:hypothetical protein
MEFMASLLSVLCAAIGVVVGAALLWPLQRCRAPLAALVLGTALLSAVPDAFAGPAVTSEITPRSGGLDDLYIFTVTIEGAQTQSPPQLSGGTDFSLQLLGPQTSISIINGTVRSRAAYIYQLKPKREGELSTPRVEVTINGSIFSAAPITVEVQGGAAANAPSGAGGRGEPDRVSLEQQADPEEVYQGQQVVNTIKLRTRVELQGLTFDDLTADGFWQESLADRKLTTPEYIRGTEYTVVDIRRALFPLRSGTIDIPVRSAVTKVAVRRKSSTGLPGFGLFDDDFLGSIFQAVELQDLSLASNKLTVRVKPLPTPPDALHTVVGNSPLVGATSVEVQYEVDAINVGESKTVSISVVTAGNINPFKSLELVAPTGVKIYSEQPKTEHNRDSAELISRRTFRFSVVPLRPGLIRIPGVQVPFFDPLKGEYQIAKSSDIAFPVRGQAIVEPTPAPGSSNAVGGGSSPLAVGPGSAAASSASSSERLSQPLPTLPAIASAPPRAAPALTYEEPTLLEQLSEQISLQLAILALASVLALTVVVWVVTRLRPSDGSSGELAALADTQSSADLEAAVRAAAVRRLTGAQLESTLDQLRALVAAQVRDQELALAIRSLLDDLEVVRYGGGGEASQGDLKGLRARAREVLRQWR